jgi:hypothetical protein
VCTSPLVDASIAREDDDDVSAAPSKRYSFEKFLTHLAVRVKRDGASMADVAREVRGAFAAQPQLPMRSTYLFHKPSVDDGVRYVVDALRRLLDEGRVTLAYMSPNVYRDLVFDAKACTVLVDTKKKPAEAEEEPRDETSALQAQLDAIDAQILKSLDNPMHVSTLQALRGAKSDELRAAAAARRPPRARAGEDRGGAPRRPEDPRRADHPAPGRRGPRPPSTRDGSAKKCGNHPLLLLDIPCSTVQISTVLLRMMKILTNLYLP